MNTLPRIESIFFSHTSHQLQHDSSSKLLTRTESQEVLTSGFIIDCSHPYMQHFTVSAKVSRVGIVSGHIRQADYQLHTETNKHYNPITVFETCIL
jgi:hypothetical protein